MKKFFKIFAIAAIAVAAAIACAFAGCKKDDGDDNSADYNFTIVYEDNTAVNGQTGGAGGGKVATQICLPDGSCVPLVDPIGIYPDANGKLSLSQAQVNEFFSQYVTDGSDVTVFVFHVIGVPGHKNDCEVAVNGKGNYTVTVTAN